MASFDAAWRAFEEVAGPKLADALRDHAPVGDPETDPDSGTLAASMTFADNDGWLEAGSDDPRGPIAAYVTRGTAPHPIEPVNARFLHFFVGGEEVFALHVDHPGTAPDDFHIRAWEETADEITSDFRDEVGAGYALAFLNPWRNRTIII